MAGRNFAGLGFVFTAVDRTRKTVEGLASGFGRVSGAADNLSGPLDRAGRAIEGFASSSRSHLQRSAQQTREDFARLTDMVSAFGESMPKAAASAAKSLLRAGASVDQLSHMIAIDLPEAAWMAGKDVDKFVTKTFDNMAKQLEKGAPLSEIVRTLGEGIPDAAKESKESIGDMSKEGSKSFKALGDAVGKLKDAGIGKLKTAVSGLGMSFMSAATAGKSFVSGLSKAGLSKVGSQVRSLAGDLSGLPGQLTSGINLTTGLEATYAAMGKASRQAGAQAGLTGDKLQKFAGQAASMNYSLEIGEEAAIKALMAWESYGDLFDVLGLKSAEELAKWSHAFGVDAGKLGPQLHMMRNELGMTDEQIKSVMSSTVAMGREIWSIPAAYQMLESATPMLETQRFALGKSEAQVADFADQLMMLGAAGYQMHNNTELAISDAQAIGNVLTENAQNWDKMLAGMGDAPEMLMQAAKAGVDVNDVMALMREGPMGFMEGLSKLNFNQLSEDSEVFRYIHLQMTEALGGDVQMASRMLKMARDMATESDGAIFDAVKRVKDADEDFGKMQKEAFRTGRTLQEIWDRQVESFVVGFRKHGRPAAREFVKDAGKQFKKFNKQMSQMVAEGGPMGQLVTKFSEVHQIGVLALMPERVRPMAAAVGTLYQNLSPVVTAMQQLGIRVADLATPTAALAAGVGALVYAYVAAREESEKTVESMASSDSAMRKQDKAIRSLEKQLSKAGKETKEYESLQKQLDKRVSEHELAKAMRADNLEIERQQKLLKQAKKNGQSTVKAQAQIALAEERLAGTRKKIQEASDERTRQGIREMFKRAIEMGKLFLSEVPGLLRSLWPEIRKVLGDLGELLRDGLFGAVSDVGEGGGIAGKILDSVVNAINKAGEQLGPELEAAFDPKKGTKTLLGAILESMVTLVTEVVPRFLEAIAGALARINVGKIAQQLGNVLVTMVEWAIGFLDKVIPILAAAFDQIASALVPVLGDVIARIVTALPPLVTSLVSSLVGILDGLIPVLAEAVFNIGVALVGALPSIAESIVSGLSTLITTLADALTSILPVLIPALGGVLLRIADAVIEALPGVLTSVISVLDVLLEALVGTLSNIIPDILTNLVGLIANALPEVATFLMGAIETIVAGLAQMVTTIDWSGLLSQLLASIISVIEMIYTSDFLGNVLASLTEMIGPLASGLIDFVGKAFVMLGEMDLEGIYGNLTNVMTTLVERLPAIMIPLLKKFFEILPDILLNLVEVALKLNIIGTTMVIKLGTALFGALMQVLPTLLGQMVKMFAWEMPKMAILLLVDIFTDIIPGVIWDLLKSIGSMFVSGIVNALSGILMMAVETFKGFFIYPILDIVDWFIGSSVVVDMFQAGFDRILGIFTSIGETILGVFSTLGELLLSAVTGYFDLLVGFWEGVFWGIVDTAMWAAGELIAFVTDPIGWIQDAWTSLPDIFWGVFEDVKSFVSDAINSIMGWVDDALGAVGDAAEGVYDTFEYLFGSSVHTFIRDDLAQAEMYTTQWADHTDTEAGRAFGGMTGRSRQFRDRAMQDAEQVKSAWAAAEGFLAEGKLGKMLGGEGLGGILKGLPTQATVLLGGKTEAEKEAERAAFEAQKEADIAKAMEDMAKVQLAQEETLTKATLERLKVRKEAFDKAVKFEEDSQETLEMLRRAANMPGFEGLTEDLADLEKNIAEAYEKAGVSATQVEFGRMKDYGQDLNRQIKQAQDTILAIESGTKTGAAPAAPGRPSVRPPTPGTPKTMGAVTRPRAAPVDLIINPPDPSINDMIAADLASLDVTLLTWQSLTQVKMVNTTEEIARIFEGMTDRIGTGFENMWLELLDLTASAAEAIDEDVMATGDMLGGIIADLQTATGLRSKITADEIAAEAPGAPLITEGKDPYEVIAQTTNHPSWYHQHYEPLFTTLLGEIKKMTSAGAKGGRKTEKRESSARRLAEDRRRAAQ